MNRLRDALVSVTLSLMAILTIREKQMVLGVVGAVVWGGVFVTLAFQGNIFAIILVALGVLFVVWWIRAKYRELKRRVSQDRARRAGQSSPNRGGTAAPRPTLGAAPVAALEGDTVELNFKIPVQSDDTLDSLTLRVIGAYQERGGTIEVGEARAMAEAALEKYKSGPAHA